MTSSTFVRTIACGLAATTCGLLTALPAYAQEPGEIRIVKTDQFADPVVGAVFQAFASDGDIGFEPEDPDGDPLVAECTTDAAGECVLGPLPAGEYFVREFSAPAGYERDDAFRFVTVEEGTTLVIDRATDLDGDGISDGFLNVRDETPGDGGSDPYDTYDDDPGDPDFDFETPFDGADDDGSAPGADPGTASTGDPGQPTSSDDVLSVAGEPVTPPTPAAEAAPEALSELPRTGVPLVVATGSGAALLALGLLALAGGRRRQPARRS